MTNPFEATRLTPEELRRLSGEGGGQLADDTARLVLAPVARAQHDKLWRTMGPLLRDFVKGAGFLLQTENRLPVPDKTFTQARALVTAWEKEAKDA